MKVAAAAHEPQILFTEENVRLIYSGEKIETRRIMKNQPPPGSSFEFADGVWWRMFDGSAQSTNIRCPYGRVGDTLWVRETWQLLHQVDGRIECWLRKTHGKIPKKKPEGWSVVYRAEHPEHVASTVTWRPNLFMPRWACRLLLRVEGLRAERLHDITDEGARAEGMPDVGAYRNLWDEINSDRLAWASNPWIWVVRFSRITEEHDARARNEAIQADAVCP